VTLLVAAYWAGDAFRAMLASLRLSANDDTPRANEVAPVVTAELPIDVEPLEEEQV
jgi:hypothetical protein